MQEGASIWSLNIKINAVLKTLIVFKKYFKQFITAMIKGYSEDLKGQAEEVTALSLDSDVLLDDKILN